MGLNCPCGRATVHVLSCRSAASTPPEVDSTFQLALVKKRSMATEKTLCKTIVTLTLGLNVTIVFAMCKFVRPLANFFTIAAIIASSTAADESPTIVRHFGNYQLPHTHDFLVTSSNGHDFRVLVSEPNADAPPEGFPVLYVLDANSCFGTAVDLQRIHARRSETASRDLVLIVGIGYPGDHSIDTVRRTLDYTIPAEIDALPPRRNGAPWPPSGGAETFLDFIQEDVKPLINHRFQVDQQRQAIFGHSFGGLFVLHALFTRPETFQAYIASSPSVWWGDFAIGAEEKSFRKRSRRSPVSVRLRVTTAELEKGTGPAARLPTTPSSRAFGGAREMADRLGELTDCGLVVEFHEFQDEDHGSVIPLSLNRGLHFASATRERNPADE